MKKIGIDVDGVIADFLGAYLRIANKAFGTSYTPADQHEWEFKQFSKEQDDFVWYTINHTKDFWEKLGILPGTNRLYGLHRECEPYFITSRTPTLGKTVQQQTNNWLRQNFGITYPVVLVVDKPSQKIPIVKALDLVAFIDDKGSTVKQMAAAEINSYLLDATHNQDVTVGTRVKSLDEYLEALLGN